MKWIECTLGDILNFRRGYDLPHSEMSGGDIPVAGSNGVIGYHNKATDISPVITIGRSGNVGTPYIYDRAWAHNTTLFIDDFKGNDPLYLYYLIKTLPLASFGGGSAVPTLNRNHIHPLIVKHCPDVEEQKRIASFLNAFDEKIELNKRINHNLEDFLLSLYGRLLDSQCGSSTIGQVSERVYSGGTPDTKNSDYWGGTINWLSSGETSNHFIIDTEKRITENGVLHSSTKFASKYDVVIASAGQGNTRGQTSMTLLDTCINQSVIVIHANTYEAPIVFCSLANRYDELRAISDASSIRGSLTTKMISALEIPVFPEVETFKFASQAKCIIDQVENNLRENRSLTMMRDSLLPKLMRGGLS